MSELKPSDVAGDALAWSVIETEAKARKEACRAWLTDHLGPDLLAVAAQVNGQQVGKASYSLGSPEFKVTDSAAFMAFVVEQYPTEIEVVTQVNSAFQKRLLGELQAVGGTAIDTNGVPVPGVELQPGKPRLTITKDKGARDTIAAALAGGRLSLDPVKELEA